MQTPRLTRRATCLALAAAAIAGPAGLRAATAAGAPMLTRKIPRSGEAVPVIGMGSSGTFDVGDGADQRAELAEVLRTLFAQGGRIIDSSPMYGRSEAVIGDLLRDTQLASRAWLATKVWTRGRAAGAEQIADSMGKLRTTRLDLLQIHNLLDWREHLPTLRALAESGKVRYTGLTHYRDDQHAALEEVLRAERFDWVQFNYSIGERAAEQRLLPFCAGQGIAVMVNRPFQDGALFERVRGRPLPGWAAELGIASWGQYFLKYAISHPAVTCVIPATSKAKHMLDNAGAGQGPLPDERQRARMVEYLETAA
jgi:aryl-alcohol dehydrogenase-like predicted oxidoreductase